MYHCISRTRRSRGMISAPIESSFQPFSMRVEVNLLELIVLDIFLKGNFWSMLTKV